MSEWREAGTVSEFDATDRKLLDLGGGRMVGVFKVEGAFYAVDGWCSHERASLMNGDVEGCEVMCPIHGARFDLRTGRHLSMPAVRPIASYPVKVEGGSVWVKV